MRALRRGLLSYWYATLEGGEAAAIEAATATWYVNILDEAVFEHATATVTETFGPTTASAKWSWD
jgi:hypothetical protein